MKANTASNSACLKKITADLIFPTTFLVKRTSIYLLIYFHIYSVPETISFCVFLPSTPEVFIQSKKHPLHMSCTLVSGQCSVRFVKNQSSQNRLSFRKISKKLKRGMKNNWFMCEMKEKGVMDW